MTQLPLSMKCPLDSIIMALHALDLILSMNAQLCPVKWLKHGMVRIGGAA
jgi:hypothetical protein